MASLILHSLTLILLSCSFTFPLDSNTGDAALNNRNHLVDQKHRQFRYPAHSDVDTNGKFLRVILLKTPPHLDMTRNASGHLIEVFGVGVSLLEWLSRVLNFKYIFLQDNIYTVGDSPAGKGLMSAIVEGRAEMILGSVAMINDRQQNLSFPYPFVFGKYGFIIPMPSAQSDIVAVWKPFQYQIWIGLLVSLFATTFFLQGINYSINAIYKEKATKTIRTNRGVYVEDLLRVLKYVIGVLFSQGTTVQSETAANQKLAIRILAGAWCLTCFVLVSAYSNVLISFVTSPNYKPIVDSIYDFPKNPQVKITVTRGLSPDLFFSSAENGPFKYFGDQLRREPELRCSATEQCLDKVRNGSFAYTMGDRTLQDLVGIDLKRTGRCDFTIAKDHYLNYGAGIALPKMVNVEFYNRGILKAHEGGFVNFWYDRNMADPSRCLNVLHKRESEKIRLTLGGLSGAFVGLAFGCGLSLLVFLMEVIFKGCFSQHVHII